MNSSHRFIGLGMPGAASAALILGLFAASSLSAATLTSDRWSQFRGLDAQESAQEAALPSSSYGLKIEWDQAVGSGYSQISVAGGKVFTEFTSGEVDVVAAFDATSGKELWRYTLDTKYVGHDGSVDGPLATPTIFDGVVYAVGPKGQFVALDATTGARRWGFDLTEDNSTLPEYGYTTSPIVVGDTVVLATGGEGHAITALDRFTGEPKWAVGNDVVAYQTPSFVEVDGQSVLVAVTNQKILGINVETGQSLWEIRHSEGNVSEQEAHVVPAGEGRFLVNFGSRAKLYQASANQVEEVWETRGFGNSLGIPVRVGDHFYGFRRQVLACVEVDSGEIVWRSRKPGGQGITSVGNTLAVVDAGGDLVLIDATPDGYQEITRVKALEAGNTHFPSFSDGRFFVRDMHRLVSVKVDRGLEPSPKEVEVTQQPKGKFGQWITTLDGLPVGERQAAVDEYFSKVQTTPLFEDGGLVHFVWRGEAEDVAIGGDPAQGAPVSLVRVEGTDLFVTSVELETTGQYSYSLSVDYGPPGPDPGNPYTVDQGFATIADLRMPDWPASPHLQEPGDGVRKGDLDSFQFHSEILGNARNIQVWKPPGYRSAEDRYPVLVANHGNNLLIGGLFERTLNNMVGNSVRPLLAVFVPRAEGSEYGGEKADDYNRFLVEELLPHIDRHYRTDGTKRAIMGPGSGGVSAVYAALRFPTVFSKAATQSFYPVEPAHARIAELLNTQSDKPEAIFVVHSPRDYPRPDGTAPDFASKQLVRLLGEASVSTTEMSSNYSPGYAGWRGHHDDILMKFFPLEESD